MAVSRKTLAHRPQTPIEQPKHLAGALSALKHGMARRAELPHIGDQTDLDPLLVGDRILAEPVGVILASHLFLLRIGGSRTRKTDQGHYERKRDHLLHSSTPMMAEGSGWDCYENSEAREPSSIRRLRSGRLEDNWSSRLKSSPHVT